MALTFGNVKKPKIVDAIVTKGFDGAGYNTVPPRWCLGACEHITDGVPPGSDEAQIEWYRAFFSVGGQRANDALVDYVIATGGTIARLNDPFGTRMPWASGGSDGLEGDGPAFVAARGIFGINGELASKEHVAKAPNKMTSAQLESSAKLNAWLFDGASNHSRGSKVPWDQFPFNPNKGVGCVTDMAHFEFATKSCPAAGIIGQIDELQAVTRGIMKAGQTAVPPVPDPTPGPVTPPQIVYPAGMDLEKATAAFGVGELYRPNKAMNHFGFKETSAVSLAWLRRGGKNNAYPKVLSWHQVLTASTDMVEVVTFADNTILWRPAARAAWTWM